jgi:ribosomal-protein-alanine N-acetyltransferase
MNDRGLNDRGLPLGAGLAGEPATGRVRESGWQARPMTRVDLPEVSRIEADIFQAPWSHGNFADSLQAGYDCWIFQTAADRAPGILGYSILMWTPDDLHLLNLSVDRACQGKGFGRTFLAWLLDNARSRGASSMLLEVRPSNIAGLRLYEWGGFQRIGLRRGYYPAHQGQREDAIVMRRRIEAV